MKRGESKASRVMTGDLRANRYFPRTDEQKVSHAEKRPTSESTSSRKRFAVAVFTFPFALAYFIGSFLEFTVEQRRRAVSVLK